MFENGRLLVDYTLEEIRERAEIELIKELKRKRLDGDNHIASNGSAY